MVPTTLNANPSLSEFLHARALASAPQRLVVDLVCGTLIAATALWIRPAGWVAIASAGFCFALYGLWAVAARNLDAIGSEITVVQRRGWRAMYIVTAIFGVVEFGILVFSLLALTLGTWIS